jgi:tetratricopeptide (TPR) repeat protein
MTQRFFPLWLLALLMALPAHGQDDVSIVEVPPARLEALDDNARAMLQRAADYFERQRGGLSGRELGIGYGRVGLHYLAHGQYASAEAAFANAASLDSENFRWPYYLGLTQEAQGNRDQAIALFGRSLRLNADNPAAATRLGLALIDAGRGASAGSLLEGVIASDNRPHAAAEAGLGRLALERGDYREAVARYQKALSQQAGADALHGVLSQAYAKLGETEAARHHASKVGAGLPVIQDPLVALLDAHRQPSSRFIELGDQARQRGQIAQAAVFYDFAAAVNPEDPDAGERIAGLKNSASVSAGAVKAAPTSADFFERGVYFAATGDDDSAIREYEASIELDPNDVAAHLFLGNARMRQQAFAQAAQQYGLAAARDDKNAEIRYREGMAWMAAATCERAETALLAAYELEPTALRVVQAIARLYATCPVDDEKRRQALKYAQLLYNAQPALETAATLAMVLAANGQFEDAADYQRQAIFEALKSGRAQSDPSLGANLERYVNGQPSERAWPLDHPIFRPARPQPRG